MEQGEHQKHVWVKSGGGPLLLLANDLLGFWEGIKAPPPFRRIDAEFRWRDDALATDYDRACDVKEYVAEIPVGLGRGLVLGDEPLPTTWLASEGASGGCFVRVVWAPAEQAVIETMRCLPPDLHWRPESARITVEDSGLVLFDAAEPGQEILGSQIRVHLNRGTYKIATVTFEPTAEMALLLHRFETL